MTEPTATAPSRWAAGEGALIVLAALFALAFLLWLPSTHVEEADYQAVAKTLEAEAQAGDVVLLHPWWTERARLYLPERVPIVGYLGSDQADLIDHPRVWVLDEPRLPRADEGGFEAAFLPSRTEVGEARRFGNLSLRLFTNGRHRPLRFSAKALVAQLSVYLEGPDGGRQSCPWNGTAHVCPNGKTVLPEWHEVHFEPRPCLRFDAPGGPTRLVVELPPVPAADTLVLRTGYTWERGAYREGMSDSEVGLEVEGKLERVRLPAGVEAPVTLTRADVTDGARVRAWVQANNPAARELCLEVYGYGRAR